MAIYGKLHSSGELTDIYERQAQSWPDGSTDVVLVVAPAFGPPYTYDSINFLAVQAYPPVLYLNWTQEIVGFTLFWQSATQIIVGQARSGQYANNLDACIDATGVTQIIGVGQWLLNITNPTTTDIDSFTGPGTVTASASASLVGTSTTFLTSFAPLGVPRVGTGTITSSGAAVSAGTTATGFMSGIGKLALGDLIGNTTSGYFQVIAIADDLHCTINATPGTPFSNSAFNVIENPWIKMSNSGTQKIYQVTKIADNTHLTLNAVVTVTGGTYTIGGPFDNTANFSLSMPSTTNWFLYVWTSVGIGTTQSMVYLSTQRTRPFGIPAANDYVRRIGRVLISSNGIVPFTQIGGGRNRWYQYEITNNTDGTRVLAAGTATAWTAVICSAVVSPTDCAFSATLTVQGSAGLIASIRQRGVGDSTATRPFKCSTAGSTYSVQQIQCDGAQAIDYAGNSGVTLVIDVFGAMEIL